MDREQKKQLVQDINSKLQEASTVVVTHYRGLTVEEFTKLRSSLRELGASFIVTKNSLTKLALVGTKFEGLSDQFTGPTAIAISEDPVAAAKGIVEFDNDKLIILAGALNEEIIDESSIKSLAKMPSLDELRAKIISVINTPATRIAGVLQAPAGQIARVIKAYSDKG